MPLIQPQQGLLLYLNLLITIFASIRRLILNYPSRSVVRPIGWHVETGENSYKTLLRKSKEEKSNKDERIIKKDSLWNFLTQIYKTL